MVSPELQFLLPMALGAVGGIIGMVLIIPIFVFWMIYVPVMLMFVSIEESATICTDFKRIFTIAKTNSNMMITVILGSILAGIVAGVGMIALGVGFLFTYFIAYGFLYSHILGQFYAKCKK